MAPFHPHEPASSTTTTSPNIPYITPDLLATMNTTRLPFLPITAPFARSSKPSPLLRTFSARRFYFALAAQTLTSFDDLWCPSTTSTDRLMLVTFALLRSVPPRASSSCFGSCSSPLLRSAPERPSLLSASLCSRDHCRRPLPPSVAFYWPLPPSTALHRVDDIQSVMQDICRTVVRHPFRKTPFDHEQLQWFCALTARPSMGYCWLVSKRSTNWRIRYPR